MGRKQDQIAELLRQGKKHEADILGAGGRLAQAAKTEELANRVTGQGFTYTGNTYTLKAGEDYFSLAQRLYGNSSYFSIIAKYNGGLIPKAGMTIKIPVIAAAPTLANSSVAPTAATTTNLPPGAGEPATGLATPPGGLPGMVSKPTAAYGGVINQRKQDFLLGDTGQNLGSTVSSSLGGAQAGISSTPAVGSYAWKQGIDNGTAPQVTLTPPALETNRFAGEQPTFANPQLGQQSPVVKPASGAVTASENDPDIVQSRAIQTATFIDNNQQYPRTITADAAKLLGIDQVLADPQSGYFFDGTTYSVDPYAEYALSVTGNGQASSDFTFEGGSVPRPDIVYRRRTPAELTRGDVAVGQSSGGYTRYYDPYNSYEGTLNNVVNWRVSFA